MEHIYSSTLYQKKYDALGIEQNQKSGKNTGRAARMERKYDGEENVQENNDSNTEEGSNYSNIYKIPCT